MSQEKNLGLLIAVAIIYINTSCTEQAVQFTQQNGTRHGDLSPRVEYSVVEAGHKYTAVFLEVTFGQAQSKALAQNAQLLTLKYNAPTPIMETIRKLLATAKGAGQKPIVWIGTPGPTAGSHYSLRYTPNQKLVWTAVNNGDLLPGFLQVVLCTQIPC